MSPSLSILLQVADSAFPTGAFAYSSGLEALARAGRFQSAEALETYLEAYVKQAELFDLAFVSAAHQATRQPDAFGGLCQTWDAFQWNHSLRKASLRQGRVYLDLLRELFPDPELDALRKNADANRWPLHFAPALGLGLAVTGISVEETCAVYLHGLIRDQVAAIVRLGLLGPRACQSMQARILSRSQNRVDLAGIPSPEDARRTSPIVEVGQGGHEFLYSRLFQN